MASSSVSFTRSFISKTNSDTLKAKVRFVRSYSGKDFQSRAAIRRCYSDNHLCCSASRMYTSTTTPKLNSSCSTGGFPLLQLSINVVSDPIKPLQFDQEEASNKLDSNDPVVPGDHESELLIEKRVNWVERLMEIRSQWRSKQQKGNLEDGITHSSDHHGCDAEDGCGADYGDDDNFDEKSFSSLLRLASLSDTKHFSQLAFLCNMAYAIPKIKAEDLRRYHGLEFVTSSLEKKTEAADRKARYEQQSMAATSASAESNPHKSLARPLLAYEIAASAASYVHSRAKDILSLGSEPYLELNDVISHQEEFHQEEKEEWSPRQIYRSEMAAQVATSTMTAVVAADEKQKQEAAKDLQSINSSPCEWFICDDSSIYTRCFIIQGSDSLASWQANLFFEPTKFEGTDVLVHRGIYEAAKGIYEQFMPEIMQHLDRFGNRAKLQFTGHSLGGSLSLLVNLMLLTRKVVHRSALLPVVTFGSPFVFCGGHKILNELGLEENHIQCIIMHRDIVPKAFSCSYPDQVVQVLKRLNGTFRSHPCLEKYKLLYTPMGKIFILQPDEKTSPAHPLLQPGRGIYTLESRDHSNTRGALKAFLNCPHPLETLSDPAAYGSDGTIIRDHDSSNYLKAVNDVIKQHTKQVVREARNQRHLLWPLLASQSPHAWGHEHNWEASRLRNHKVMTGV